MNDLFWWGSETPIGQIRDSRWENVYATSVTVTSDNYRDLDVPERMVYNLVVQIEVLFRNRLFRTKHIIDVAQLYHAEIDIFAFVLNEQICHIDEMIEATFGGTR